MTEQKHIENEYSGTAEPVKMPKPTYFPFLMAFSLMFFFWGLISLWTIALSGLIGTGISLAGWINDLMNEVRETGK